MDRGENSRAGNATVADETWSALRNIFTDPAAYFRALVDLLEQTGPSRATLTLHLSTIADLVSTATGDTLPPVTPDPPGPRGKEPAAAVTTDSTGIWDRLSADDLLKFLNEFDGRQDAAPDAVAAAASPAPSATPCYGAAAIGATQLADDGAIPVFHPDPDGWLLF